MPPEIIQVEWLGPYTLDQVRSQFVDYDNDCGLYQIYGPHPVYGENVLLYIGKTTENSFAGRITEHKKEWLDDLESETNIEVRLGRLRGQANMEDDGAWKEMIDITEALLIYSHWPAGNTQCRDSLDEKLYYDVHILNWGEYGSLLPEVSGDRWTNKHWK